MASRRSPVRARLAPPSAHPSDAVPLRRSSVRIRPERPRLIRRRELPKEPLETSWRSHNEQPPFSRDDSTLRVRHAARREHEPTRARRVFLVADREHVLALEYVEQLVFLVVDVQRRVGHGGTSSNRVNAPPVASEGVRTRIMIPPNASRSASFARRAYAGSSFAIAGGYVVHWASLAVDYGASRSSY
jgi:hypothetical protein